jgi:hypothetical protein
VTHRLLPALGRLLRALGKTLLEAVTPRRRGVLVTRARFESDGKRWPLTVARARVVTEGQAVHVRVRGATYALNGLALKHHQAITPIWRTDEQLAQAMSDAGATEPPRIPLTPLLRLSRSCTT